MSEFWVLSSEYGENNMRDNAMLKDKQSRSGADFESYKQLDSKTTSVNRELKYIATLT